MAGQWQSRKNFHLGGLAPELALLSTGLEWSMQKNAYSHSDPEVGVHRHLQLCVDSGKSHSHERSPCGVRDGPRCSHCPSHTPSINSVTSLVSQRGPCQQGVAVTLHVTASVGHVGTIQERSVLCSASAGPDCQGQRTPGGCCFLCSHVDPGKHS